MTEDVEFIQSDDQTIAILIRASLSPEKTTFISPEDHEQQVGFVVYPAQGEIQAHKHVRLDRHIQSTSETLIVRKGQAEVRLYDEGQNLVAERILDAGDILVLVSGGHGFRMLEDTVLLEVKQGPYTGLKEKEHF